MSNEITAGGLRGRIGPRNPALVFGVLGVLLVAGGLVAPAFETLLVAWGGTALFVALLLRLVMTGPTLPSAVTTDVYTAMAGNVRRLSSDAARRYVPDADGVALVVGDREFDAVGERLLATSDDVAPTETVDDRLSVLVDVLVNDLELAARATATTDDGTVTVTATGCRVGTTELFDHPVASVIGVGLARQLDASVDVETSREDGGLVVTATPTATR